MRSRIVVAAVLLLFSAVLVMAGGQDEGEADGGAVPVKVWLPGGAQDDQAAVNQAAMDYAAPLIGAYPEVQFFGWGEWGDRKQLAIQSGEEMDVVFTAEWDRFYQDVARNAWLPLDDLIDEHAPSLYETVGFFLEGPVVNGQIYAIPTVKEGADSAQWIFNAELVERYGIPIDEIVTAEDLSPYLAIIAENEPNVIPYLVDPGVSSLDASTLRNTWYNVGVGRDFWYFEDTDRVQHIWNRDEAWAAFEQMREWYLAGYFQPEIEDVGGESNHAKYFDSGDWFAYSHVGHPGKTGEMSAAYGYTIIGTGPVDQPVVSTQILLGSMMAISRTTERAVESIKVLELMNTDRLFNNLLNYGIEGEHYTFVDESAGVIEAVPDSGYAPNMQWALQNQFNTYLFPTEDPNKWEKYAAFNETGRLSPVVGFAASQDNVRTQFASLTNVQDQYNDLLQRGLVEPSDLRDEVFASLEAAGVDDVEADLTAQVQEFFASK
ncbi:MAG TPA: ABC transporter substrate-binding protein [Spirochaetia bacterium]|nr:ABC transporter substrate-binding protein [Spirochaetia bacterium]